MSVGEESPRLRPAARAVIVEPGGRVLLIHHVMEDGYAWWATPGGGIDPGETPEAAARREVVEETGLTEFELGPCLWLREVVYPFRGTWYRQPERFYLVRVPEFAVTLTADPSPSASLLREHRWWAVEEIRAAEARFAPRTLADLLERLLREGPRAAPFEVD
jgi:ADP-ribose pyrophosphatase YjhB (NUDIX family)